METVAFNSIGFHAAMIMNKLRIQARLTEENNHAENEERPADRKNGDRAKANPDQEREYIEQRLRELAAWERRISGNKKRGSS